MLGERDAIATLAVKNIEAARKFYESALGLQRTGDSEPGTASYRAGTTTMLVYESQYAGTNKATAVTWMLGDGIDDTVQALKAKGVAFEQYDFPNTTREGDVHVMGTLRLAWFKDPDGNTHALINR
jgi:catechol 2,3-dioxygenase-like lactoylglutathione lyase family enzyme